MHALVVSSFPRSGNTWVRFVLATAALGRRPSSFELDQSTPDAHKVMPPPEAWLTDPALILKSHFTPRRLAAFLDDFGRTFGKAAPIDGLTIAHIVRNPFDVALSVKNFVEVEDRQFDQFFDHFVDPEANFPAQFMEWGFGSWASANAAWAELAAKPGGNAHIFKYEDLIARPAENFEALFALIGLEPRLPLQDCLALCAPDALRKAEDAEIASGADGLFKSYRKGKRLDRTRFVNRAAAGGYRAALTPAQMEKGLSLLGPLMQRLGYDCDAFWAAAA